MKRLLLLAAPALLLLSCNWAKDKTKAAVHRTGEVVAVAGSEFADGVAKGVERSFSSRMQLDKRLQDAGLQSGKMTVSSDSNGTDNKLSVYLIFNKTYDGPMRARLLDGQQQEYGRVNISLKGEAGSARYVDFSFDPRTNIDGRGTIVFE